MSIGSLMRTTDDHVDILSRKRREILVKIEIIAGHKSESDPLDLNYVGLTKLVAVAAIKLIAALLFGLDLAGSGVSLIIFAHKIALAVDSVGGISISRRSLVCGIDENYHVTTQSRLPLRF